MSESYGSPTASANADVWIRESGTKQASLNDKRTIRLPAAERSAASAAKEHVEQVFWVDVPPDTSRHSHQRTDASRHVRSACLRPFVWDHVGGSSRRRLADYHPTALGMLLTPLPVSNGQDGVKAPKNCERFRLTFESLVRSWCSTICQLERANWSSINLLLIRM